MGRCWCHRRRIDRGRGLRRRAGGGLRTTGNGALWRGGGGGHGASARRWRGIRRPTLSGGDGVVGSHGAGEGDFGALGKDGAMDAIAPDFVREVGFVDGAKAEAREPAGLIGEDEDFFNAEVVGLADEFFDHGLADAGAPAVVVNNDGANLGKVGPVDVHGGCADDFVAVERDDEFAECFVNLAEAFGQHRGARGPEGDEPVNFGGVDNAGAFDAQLCGGGGQRGVWPFAKQ